MPITVEHDIANYQDRRLIETRHGQLHGQPKYKMNRGAILTQGEQPLGRLYRRGCHSRRKGEVAETITTKPASTIRRAKCAIRRIFSVRDLAHTPKSLLRPLRTLSPSSTKVCTPCSLSRISKALHNHLGKPDEPTCMCTQSERRAGL